MVIPQLSYDLIVGRDFLNRHAFTAVGAAGGGAEYRFGAYRHHAQQLSVNSIDIKQREPQAMLLGEDSGWKVVLRQDALFEGGQQVQRLYVQVMHADGVHQLSATARTRQHGPALIIPALHLRVLQWTCHASRSWC